MDTFAVDELRERMSPFAVEYLEFPTVPATSAGLYRLLVES